MKQTISVRKYADLEYWDEYKILRVDYGVSSYKRLHVPGRYALLQGDHRQTALITKARFIASYTFLDLYTPVSPSVNII